MNIFTSTDDKAFIVGYVECAIWSSTAEDESPLDDNYNVRDFDSSAIERMADDCLTFMRANVELIERFCDEIGNGPDFNALERAGHDLWLTRNGHGAGFWDRDAGAVGDELSELARALGECTLYVGDDGLIYAN